MTSYWSSKIFNCEITKKTESISFNDSALRAMDMSQLDFENIDESVKKYSLDIEELVLLSVCSGYAFNDNISWNENDIIRARNKLIKNSPEYSLIKNTIKNIFSDMVYFPVAASVDNYPFVEYVNSWNYERTYGGQRGHEGCDIMAQNNIRDVYPVISCSSGTVEKMGWLEKGGYRIGIRSDNGIYYYYAHLAEYADLKEGDYISAGELLGFMGDTGYSDIPGTVGNFDVHLHFGIYVNDLEGNEISVNPYYFLQIIDNKVLYFDYGL
jgi:murein DD-endopeptidase MepM/ murein hydrolase activator NlpD